MFLAASKLATAALLGQSPLGAACGVEGADENELYGAMDWLLARQDKVEAALARRHLGPGALVLYDLTSVYMEGSHSPPARHGHSRDHRPDRPQVEFGLLTDSRGCPVAVEAFPGNTADPATVEAQIEKLRLRFGLTDIVLVGDRGMLTSARIERLRETGGIGWVSCLRAPAIRSLVDAGDLQLSLFDERNLAEITSPQYPHERLVVCRNPALAAERARKREALLAATEAAQAAEQAAEFAAGAAEAITDELAEQGYEPRLVAHPILAVARAAEADAGAAALDVRVGVDVARGGLHLVPDHRLVAVRAIGPRRQPQLARAPADRAAGVGAARPEQPALGEPFEVRRQQPVGVVVRAFGSEARQLDDPRVALRIDSRRSARQRHSIGHGKTPDS